MDRSWWRHGAAGAMIIAAATVGPSMLVVAKTASKADDTYYKATVPTKDLDLAAKAVIRRFSNWPGGFQSAHRALLKAGWQPDPKVNCLDGQGLGDDPQKRCRDDPKNSECKMCRDMPEISACSLGPIEYCQANFVHAGSQVVLQITTAGDMQGAPETNTTVEQFTFIKLSDPER